MKVAYLKLKNFMLYRKLKLDFRNKDVIGILAEYKDNEHRSNKGGKTTILEAIYYAITGDSRASTEAELIHHGEDEMRVELGLINGKEKHTIIRGRTRKGSGLVEVDRVNKTTEAQERINSLLGFTPKEFKLTSFFKQQDINQFMDFSPREKQKHLMKWLNNFHWVNLERAVLDDIGKIQKQVIQLKSRHQTLTEEYEDPKQLLNTVKQHQKEISDRESIRERLNKELVKLDKLSLSSKQKTELETKKKTLVRKLKQLKQELEDIKGYEVELERHKVNIKELEAIKVPSEKREKQLRQKLTDTQQEVDSLSSSIEMAQDQHTGVCPILNESCDRIQYDKAKVTSWTRSHKRLKATTQELERKLSRIERDRKRKSKAVVLQGRVDTLMVQVNRKGAVVAEIGQIRDELKKLKKQLDRGASGDVLLKADRIKAKIAEYSSQIDKLYRNIGQLKERARNAKAIKEKLDNLEQEVVQHQEKLDVHRYVAFMFGRNGIPSQEIENAFDEVEDETNFILERFGTNLQVEFSPTRELKTWEDHCVVCSWAFPRGAKSKQCQECGAERRRKRKDELTVKVMENGEQQGFHMESGGGKIMVSFSNRLALTRLQQRKTGSEFNVLFLDEPDSALDPVNKAAFMDLVTTTLVREFGFEQIFWISHDKNIQESIPHVLQVMRHQKHSTVQWL